MGGCRGLERRRRGGRDKHGGTEPEASNNQTAAEEKPPAKVSLVGAAHSEPNLCLVLEWPRRSLCYLIGLPSFLPLPTHLH